MYTQNGFTILEVVVAFTILSIVTIVTVGVVTQNTIRVNKLTGHLIAMELAETAIAEVNSAILLKTDNGKGIYQGQSSSGYWWKAEASRYVSYPEKKAVSVLPLWEVNIRVFYKNEPVSIFTLSTIMPGK